MSVTARLPFYATAEEVDAPEGWNVMQIQDAFVQLPVGQRYDKRSVRESGSIPVIDQSSDDFLGYHDEDPGVTASADHPVVTFANHTCAMRVVRHPFSVIQNVFPMIGRPEVCDTRFLYYATNGRQQTEEYKGHHPAWRRSYIALPALRYQARVADVLGTLDDLIENNRRRVEVLEEMARSIYREWFVHFRFPGHQQAAFVESSFGPTPSSWTPSTCGDELKFLGGGTPSKKVLAFWDAGTVVWYTPSDLTRDRWRYATGPVLRITEVGVAQSSARLFPAGSVMMTSRATLGVLAIATTEATTNQGFIVVLPDDRWTPGFIREWLDAHAAELASVATGATFKEITKGAFKRVPFLVPPPQVLAAYAEATNPVESEILSLERQIRALTLLRDMLLPKLVTGQIDLAGFDVDALIEGSVA